VQARGHSESTQTSTLEPLPAGERRQTKKRLAA
jgi:hypothetical protein